jgi:hypothetical protein
MFANAHFFIAFNIKANAAGLVTIRANQHDIRNMNWNFPFNNTGLRARLADGSLVLFANIHASDDQFIAIRITPDPPVIAIHIPGLQNFFHLAPSANFIAGNHLNGIAFFYSLHVYNLLVLQLAQGWLEHFRGQGNDAHKAFFAQLTSNRTENAGTARAFSFRV